MKTSFFSLCQYADDIEINGMKIDEVYLDHAFGAQHPKLACLLVDGVAYRFEDSEVEVDSEGVVVVADFPNPEDPTDEVTVYPVTFRMLNPITKDDLPC